jgi:sulfite reductase alpha subunit-like flavoprotein
MAGTDQKHEKTSRHFLQTRMPSVQAVACPPGKKAAEDVERFVAPVKSTKQLLSDTTGDRATSLVTLDLSSMPYLQYSPGDYLVVYPENSPQVSLDALENMLNTLNTVWRCAMMLQ